MMPTPIAICIEDMDSLDNSSKYLRCVAVAGRLPGLQMKSNGAVIWQDKDKTACELWVSGDNCLILYRPQGATPLTLHRAGRSLDVPFDKPVVVIDQDQIDFGQRRLRLHVHGKTTKVMPPAPFVPENKKAGRLGRAAAAMAIGSLLAAGGCLEVRDAPPSVVVKDEGTEPIDVRESPPEVMAPEETQQPQPNEPPEEPPKINEIEVRETPPKVIMKDE